MARAPARCTEAAAPARAVSALLWGGVPRQLLDAIHQGRATAFNSGALIQEFRDVLAREKFAARADAIVSGDIDLGVLESFRDIPILTPAQCLERMAV